MTHELFNSFPWSTLHLQNMDWIFEVMNHLNDEVNQTLEELKKESEKNSELINSFQEQLDKQQEQIDGIFTDAIEKLVTSVIPKLIVFGIDDTGHFVAYLPNQWGDVELFTQVCDINRCDFGRLQLRYPKKTNNFCDGG